MKEYRIAVHAGASLVCALVLVTAVYAADNNVGMWRLNLSKSKYSPGPPPKSQTTKLEAMEGGLREIVDRVKCRGQADSLRMDCKV